MFKEYNVTSVMVRAYCDDCEVELKPTGSMLACNPPLYPHVCPVCNLQANYQRVYPCVEYQTIGEAIR